jgi:hypothetical protein
MEELENAPRGVDFATDANCQDFSTSDIDGQHRCKPISAFDLT